MLSAEIRRYEKEILKGQAVPPDLRALLAIAVSAGGSGAQWQKIG